ncbi:hypothetical protein PLESTM_000035000 [Pleodorina starrii]|nr:hypothetical protein PLESTM_000035000 [Pleodorina starrii]
MLLHWSYALRRLRSIPPIAPRSSRQPCACRCCASPTPLPAPAPVQAAVSRCVPPPRPLTNVIPSTTTCAATTPSPLPGGGGGGNSTYGGESLPLDWAHLHATAGITHFAALPLYHGAALAGALTILGSNSPPAEGGQSLSSVAAMAAALGSVNGTGGGTMGMPGYLVAMASNNGAGGGGGGGGGSQLSCLDALFRAPLSLELVAMSVAQCCLGADMALARHAVEMVQAMHACASIQQLVAGISLGLQALMHARFCLTLRCNMALAVEFQPNAIMFEEVPGAQQPSGSGSQNNNWATNDVNPSGQAGRGHPVTGRTSAALSPPAQGPDGSKRETEHRMGSGGLAPGIGNGDATAAGGAARGAYNTMRSGVDTTGEPMWGASSGHVTASALLTQIVGRRYKARPFSVYHTLLIRTIHELAASSYGGTVITQCHDHMQDAKTPSRDIYALGRGVGQPPQSLVLSVTHLRPADEAMPDGAVPLAAAAAGGSSGNRLASGRNTGLSRRSGATPPPGGGDAAAAASAAAAVVSSSDAAAAAAASPENASSAAGPASASAHGVLAATDTPSPVPAEPRTYIGIYMSSTEPLPSALLELILVEVHSLACHVLSPLVHRKLLAGELAVEWSLMQMVTTSSLPQGGGGGGGDSARGRTPRQNAAAAALAATPGAVQAMGQMTAAVGGRGNASIDMGSVAAVAASVSASAGSTAVGNADGAPGDATPGPPGSAMRAAGAVAPSAPAPRLSSLQRIMAPFLMADMGAIEHLQAGAGGGGGGGLYHGGSGGGMVPVAAASGRRSSDVAAAFHASGAGIGTSARGPSPGNTAPVNAATGGIRRILAFDPQCGKPNTFAKQGRSSMSASEGVAREMMLAAAAVAGGGGGGAGGGQGPGGDKFLSTEVATVQDTHSQMGLLVTSYKETLHSMHMELSVGNIQRQSLDLHADDPGRLVLREVLGKGGHGVVFRGTMHSLEVAIKVFQTPGEDEPLTAGTANRPEVLAETLLQRRRVLTRAALELAIMSSISHPNIVQVYAQWPTALLERDETQPCRRRLRKLPPDTPPPTSGGLVCAVMVMEYCDKGTLVDAINRGDFVVPARDGSGFKANYKAIYTTLLEVALALRHLASMAVTHCDVKPANILLRSSPRDARGFTAKLADFGYAALLRDSSPDGHRSVVTDEACGTVTHMAPESFVEGEPVDSSADVYAFGILMWELISGKQPYHDRNLKQLPHEVVNKGLRPTFPPNTPDVYKSLAKSCWSPLPRNRPTAAQVVQSIQAQLDKIEAVARLLGKP